MVFVPDDVLNKNFTATQFRRGYDEHEVDDFLDEIVVELRRLNSDNDDLRAKLTSCQEDLGVIPLDTQDKIVAAREAAEQAENEAAARIAKANSEADEVEGLAAERARVATSTADEISRSVAALPAAVAGEGRGPSGDGAEPVGVGAAARVLALAEKLHEEYVSEGQSTRDRLISEGQSHHDQVVGEATAKQQELLSTGQAKHDELIAQATSRHEQLLTEARESSTSMVGEAQQKRTEVLEALGRERLLMQTKVDELRVFERDYRARLKAHLQGQLQELEQTGAADPADSDGGDTDTTHGDGERHDG